MTDALYAPQLFRYEKPELRHNKKPVVLCRSELIFGAVQVVRKGGENNLHLHRNVEGFWFVLRGRARFYTTNDEVLADLGPYEGILIPRNFPYWFESSGTEDLELLQVEGASSPLTGLQDLADGRIDLAEPPLEMAAWRADVEASEED